MTDKTAFIRDEVQALKDQGLYNTIRTIEGPQGAHLTVSGREVLNFCSNNYLGLANDPRLVRGGVGGARPVRRRAWGRPNHRRHHDDPR